MVNNFTEIAFLNVLLFIDNIVQIILWYLHITNFVFISVSYNDLSYIYSGPINESRKHCRSKNRRGKTKWRGKSW